MKKGETDEPPFHLEIEAEKKEQAVDELNLSALDLLERDPEQSKRQAASALELAREGHVYLFGTAQALFTLGRLAVSSDAFGLGLTYLLEAYTLLHGQLNPELLANVTRSIGWAHFRLGNIEESFNYLNQALSLARLSANLAREAEILTSMGAVYSNIGEHARAIELFLKSLALQDKEQGTRTKAVTLNNLALVQMHSRAYAEAIDNAEEAIKIFRILGLRALEAGSLDTLGQAYLAKGEYQQAETALNDCLTIARQIHRENTEMEALRNLGRVYRKQNCSDQACQILLQGVDLAQKHHSNRYRWQYFEILAEIFEEKRDFKTSLYYYQEFHSASEQALAESARYRLDNLKILNQVEKNQKEAEILWLQNRTLESEIDDRRQEQDELERLATIDPLTGLYNHQHFFTLGAYELEKSCQDGEKMTILLLDIDHFKQVNDNYGHPVGDQTLIDLTRLITESARKGDVCFRYGGEEFIFLLPHTGLKDGVEVAERMRIKIVEHLFGTNQNTFSITISGGVAESRPENETLTELLGRADRALYQAKSLGRNQFVEAWAATNSSKPETNPRRVTLPRFKKPAAF